MINIIPAWHQQNRWCEQEQTWYSGDRRTEFDDSVKQMQLFHRSHMVDYNIIQLAYAPNFRHFLHRQSVLRAPYWSCFDAIQEVKRKRVALLSYLNIDWPEEVEFVYSPFAVVAFLDGEKYAKVDMGKDGNPIRIDMYDHNLVCRSNIYDDRGFLSGTIVYQQGVPEYQDYLMENGIWKIRQNLKNREVQVNQQCPTYLLSKEGEEVQYTFAKECYQSMEEVICEVFSSYLALQNPEDIYCVAIDMLSVSLLHKCLEGKRIVASFYENRYRLNEDDLFTLYGLIKSTGYIVSDSEEEMKRIRTLFTGVVKNIHFISPFDTRIDMGISQQMQVQKLLVPIDDLEQQTFDRVIHLLNAYVNAAENMEVHLLTRIPGKGIVDQMMKYVNSLIEKDEEKSIAEDLGEVEEQGNNLFYVDQCVDEIRISRCMKEQRLLIDLRSKPEQYLQILAVSMGIPQVVSGESRYVEHLKNGLILENIEDLPKALDYYLKGFVNWNQAMIYSYEIGKRNTTEVLLQLWKEVILSFE